MITEYGIDAKSNYKIISELGIQFREYRIFCGLTQKEVADITRQDLLEFASRQDIKNADSVIDVVSRFTSYAEKVDISKHWTDKIANLLRSDKV